MTGRNIALTGVPRGGTTLACRLLGRCPQTVALFEPMDVSELDTRDRGQAIAQVSAFYADARSSLEQRGLAPSKQRGGEVPDNPFDHERGAGGRRRLQAHLGMIEVPRPDPGFTLVVKHNAAFTALLPELSGRFETIAIVRNPLSVLASWQTVDVPVADGHLPAGERLDPRLRTRLAAQDDRLGRQLHILHWFFERFRSALPPHRVVRYEDVVATAGAALTQVAGLQPAPDDTLRDRNANVLYAGEDVGRLLDALGPAGPWDAWYAWDDLRDVAGRMGQELL